MKCPVCKTTDLAMTERRSIEIDYCPACRGIWLDRGELDKLIAQDSTDREPPPAQRTEQRREQSHERHREYADRPDQYRGHKKKRSLFDMFDFD